LPFLLYHVIASHADVRELQRPYRPAELSVTKIWKNNENHTIGK